jgi:O-antigen/teichoic acid export membrane protein
MFPAFSISFVQDRSRTALLYGRSVKFLLLILFPTILIVIVMAENSLRLWLGPEFAERSTRVLQWLAVGVFLNCLAQVPFALVQGIGRPDLTAKVHLLELPGYLWALWMLSGMLGIEGAAIAWTARSLVDALAFFAIARRFLPSRTRVSRATTLVVISSLLILALGAHMQGLIVKGIFLLLAILGFALLAWFVVFSPEERALALRVL